MNNGMRARSALVLYSSKEAGNSGPKGYMEMFQVDGNVLHSPKRISDEHLSELTELLDKSRDRVHGFRGIVPANTIEIHGSTVSFFVPAGIKRLHVNSYAGKVKEPERLVWVPAMVLRYQGPRHKLNAWWCKGTIEDVREGKAVLTPAPMPNISRSNVCLGTSMQNVTYSSDIEHMIEVVTQRFFGSAFNDWRTDMAVSLMERCQEIAADPDITPERLQQIETAFWKNLGPDMKNHLKNNPWTRLPSKS